MRGHMVDLGRNGASPGPQEPPPNPEMQRQELVNLEKENARAIQLHNPTFFRAAYSDDFHGVSRYGETVNKAGIIRELQSLPLEFDSVVSSDAQVRMFRDAAYVLSLRSEVGRANGKKFYNQYPDFAGVREHATRLADCVATGDEIGYRRQPLACARF